MKHGKSKMRKNENLGMNGKEGKRDETLDEEKKSKQKKMIILPHRICYTFPLCLFNMRKMALHHIHTTISYQTCNIVAVIDTFIVNDLSGCVI